MRSMALTSGRSKMLPPSTKIVSNAAWATISAPAQHPTAAEAHSVAAVLRPLIFIPSFMITPGTEKAYSRDHIGDHANAALRSRQVICKIDKRRRSDGNEHAIQRFAGDIAVRLQSGFQTQMQSKD